MTRSSVRRLITLTAVGGCLAAATVPAVAEDAVVSTTVGQASSRQLALLDLAGQPLDQMALRPDVPAPFRVQVTDSGVSQLADPNSGFTVNSVLNNLYLDGDPTADFIPSADVGVSFPAGGAQNATGSLVALPRTIISGSLPGCTDLFTQLSAVLSGLSTLSGAGLALCDAVGTTGLAVDPTEVLTAAEKTLTDLADVPFTLGGQETGKYTLADYISGIGAPDSRGAGAAGTPRKLLAGVPSLSAELEALLAGLTATVPTTVTSPDGTGAQTVVADVIGEFLAAPATAELGSALAGLTPEQATAVVNLLTGAVQTLGLGDLTSVAGVYNSFPVLTATPTGTPAQGEYSGTLTVTLVQP